jgi:hypothetical protein
VKLLLLLLLLRSLELCCVVTAALAAVLGLTLAAGLHEGCDSLPSSSWFHTVLDLCCSLRGFAKPHLPCLQACFAALRSRLSEASLEDFGLGQAADLNPMLPDGMLGQMHASILLGVLQVVMEDVVAEVQQLKEEQPDAATRVRVRHGFSLHRWAVTLPQWLLKDKPHSIKHPSASGSRSSRKCCMNRRFHCCCSGAALAATHRLHVCECMCASMA